MVQPPVCAIMIWFVVSRLRGIATFNRGANVLQDKPALIYCRVSTRAQAEDGSSLGSQEKACRALARERGVAVAEVFREDYPGDSLEDRHLLLQARDLVKTRAYSALICHATDRLARNPIHLAIVAEECDKAETELLFVTEPLDNSHEGQLIRYVKGYAGAIEREKIRERTIRGKRSRAESGRLPQGNGKGIYGYRYDRESGKRQVMESEAEVVTRIFTMCTQKLSSHTIALTLNKEEIPALGGGRWHPRTILRLLKNAAYKGVTLYGQTKRVSLGGRKYRIEPVDREHWIEIPNATPQIVSGQLWQQAQQALAQSRQHPRVPNRRYLLTGYMQCECGAPVVGTRLGKRYDYYRCRGTWATAVKPRSCDAPYVRSQPLEEKVWGGITKILEQPELVLEEVKRRKGGTSVLKQEIARLQAKLRSLAGQQRKLVNLYQLDEVDDEHIRRASQQIKRDRAELEAEVLKLEKQKQEIESLDEVGEQVKKFCARATERLDGLSLEEKRLALEALQIKVVVGTSGVKLFGVIPSSYATTGQTSG